MLSFHTVEVTVKGPVDSKNGMVINITELRDIINHVVMETMDHKNLDADVAFFR